MRRGGENTGTSSTWQREMWSAREGGLSLRRVSLGGSIRMLPRSLVRVLLHLSAVFFFLFC